MADIAFSSIPQNLLLPLFWAEFDNSQAGANQTSQRALLIGQTVTSQPAVATYIATPAQAVALFGANSQLAQMVAGYKAADPLGEVWVLPLADAGAAVAAAGALAFTGTASQAGVLALYVGGISIPVAVTLGMTAAQLATAVAAAINAVSKSPVSATAAAGNVTLTAVNKGAVGNQIDLRLNYYGARNNEATPAGITCAITAMTGGATDPDLSTLDATLGDQEFDFIAMPYSGAAQLDAVKVAMDARWSWTRQVFGGFWSAKMGADATGADLLTFGAGRNDGHGVVVCYEPQPSQPWMVAAVNCGAAAQSLKADPARPLQTLSLPGLLAPPQNARFTKSTQQSLLGTGCALMSYGADGSCQILRHVTTYQKNAFGQPDQSYLDVETLFNLMYQVRFLRTRATQKFPRSKLAADGTNFGDGQPIVTPKIYKAELIAAYNELVDQGLAQRPDLFAQGLIVQLNSQNPNRLDVLFDPYLVNGLRVLAVLTQFHLKAA